MHACILDVLSVRLARDTTEMQPVVDQIRQRPRKQSNFVHSDMCQDFFYFLGNAGCLKNLKWRNNLILNAVSSFGLSYYFFTKMRH